MNYMKIFLAAILAIVSQQSFGMFWSLDTIRILEDNVSKEPRKAGDFHPRVSAPITGFSSDPNFNFEAIHKSESSKGINQLARKTKKVQRQEAEQAQATTQAMANAQAKEEAKKQAATQAKKQRAALDLQIETAERQADRFFLGGSKGKSRKK